MKIVNRFTFGLDQVTPRFQAAVGPSLDRCHIYIIGTDPKMSLCNSVCCARDYKADLTLSNPKVCLKCKTAFWKLWNEQTARPKVLPTAADFGVSSLEF